MKKVFISVSIFAVFFGIYIASVYNIMVSLAQQVEMGRAQAQSVAELNMAIQEYNVYLKQFPNAMIAAYFHFEPKSYYADNKTQK